MMLGWMWSFLGNMFVKVTNRHRGGEFLLAPNGGEK